MKKDMDLATIYKYVAAVEQLTKFKDFEVREFARDLLGTMASPEISVFEVLEPLITLPRDQLTRPEQVLRIVALGGSK